jgi:hypothetical protein
MCYGLANHDQQESNAWDYIQYLKLTKSPFLRNHNDIYIQSRNYNLQKQFNIKV